MLRALLVVFFGACSLYSQASAQAQDRATVYVGYSGDDELGEKLAFQLKEELRASSTFEVVPASSLAVFEFKLVTLDPDEEYQQRRTIYSSSILLTNDEGLDYYLTSSVGLCGRSKLEACAEGLVQNLGVEYENVIEALVAVLQAEQDP